MLPTGIVLFKTARTAALAVGIAAIALGGCTPSTPAPDSPRDRRYDPNGVPAHPTIVLVPEAVNARPDSSRKSADVATLRDISPATTTDNDEVVEKRSLEMLLLEDQLIAEINRLRQDPASYVQALRAFRDMYDQRLLTIPGQLTLMTREGKPAVNEALAVVKHAEPLHRLSRSNALSRAARTHARDLSTRTELTHIGRDSSRPQDRILRFGPIAGVFAENIGAGYDRADLLVMQLLVDDGVPTRVHRFHLLAPMLNVIGVGCTAHTTYRVVCVMKLIETFR